MRERPKRGALGLFVLGLLIWSLVEYVLHRWLFHFVSRSAWGKRQMFFLHGYHHEFPSDGLRLVAPIFMSWPVGILFGVIYYLIAGPAYRNVIAGPSPLPLFFIPANSGRIVQLHTARTIPDTDATE